MQVSTETIRRSVAQALQFVFCPLFLATVLFLRWPEYLWSVSDAPSPIRLIVVMIGLGMAYAIPFGFLWLYTDWRMPKMDGFSTQTLWEWCSHRLRAGLMAWCGTLFVCATVFFSLKEFTAFWWMAAALLVSLGQVVSAAINPELSARFLHGSQALRDPRLEEVAGRCFQESGVRPCSVRVRNVKGRMMDLLAECGGIGPTSTITLSSTLIEEYTPEEVEVVLAHEIAHYSHRHVLKLQLLAGLFVFVTLFAVNLFLKMSPPVLQPISDIDAIWMTFLIMMLWSYIDLLTVPAFNFAIRRFEWEADSFALRFTNNPTAFRSQAIRLPNGATAPVFHVSRFDKWLLYNHPPLEDLLALADLHEAQNAVEHLK